MHTALVLGYSAFDLGVFNEKDIRLKIIKKAIRRDLERLAEEGLQWLVFTGSLGFEHWVLEVAKEMKDDYGFQLATIFDFETHGSNWNEANQIKLSDFKQVDFIKYAYPAYEHKNETKLRFFYELMKKKDNYITKRLTFEDLNEIAENFSEN